MTEHLWDPASAGFLGERSKRLVRLFAFCALCVLCASPWTPAQDSPSDTIRIGIQRNGGYDVATMPLETYVARVLTGEALPGSDPAALEALAIAVRTYTAANRGKHRADGFDLCDQTHCQVMRTATPETDRAAAATAGQILLYDGAPASIYYSASCGGRTERPSNVWPGADDPPYLPVQDDDGCSGSPQWSAELTTGDLQRAFAAAGYRGTLRGIRATAHNQSGRVQVLSLEGLTPSEISGQDLRAVVGRTLGWQRVMSTWFELKRSGDAYRFTGRGSGHGVGMCVIGSTKLAIRGLSAAEILKRYYPGTTISRERSRSAPAPRTTTTTTTAPSPPLPTSTTTATATAAAAPTAAAIATPSDILVSLPEGDDGERPVIAGLVARERDRVARELGVAAPPRVSLRFHPTTSAYEQASRQPWFTLATRTTELQFVPLTLLRDRGILERTIRRELVHTMVDDALAARPLWVRDGIASYYADPDEQRDRRASARTLCPGNGELLQPISPGALVDAHARARTCVAQQIESGRSWRDIK
jgi:SpoIID/LytB domain protein